MARKGCGSAYRGSVKGMGMPYFQRLAANRTADSAFKGRFVGTNTQEVAGQFQIGKRNVLLRQSQISQVC